MPQRPVADKSGDARRAPARPMRRGWATLILGLLIAVMGVSTCGGGEASSRTSVRASSTVSTAMSPSPAPSPRVGGANLDPALRRAARAYVDGLGRTFTFSDDCSVPDAYCITSVRQVTPNRVEIDMMRTPPPGQQTTLMRIVTFALANGAWTAVDERIQGLTIITPTSTPAGP